MSTSTTHLQLVDAPALADALESRAAACSQDELALATALSMGAGMIRHLYKLIVDDESTHCIEAHDKRFVLSRLTGVRDLAETLDGPDWVRARILLDSSTERLEQ